MIYVPQVEIPSEGFIQSSSGNIISRTAVIRKPQAMEVPGGKVFIDTEAELRTDLAPIQLNKYVYVSKRVKLEPCNTLMDPKKYIPMTVGANSFIDEGSVIEAAAIGQGCDIGKNCKISKRCILKDYVKVLDDTVIPPDMVLPPFAIVGGSPAQILSEQPESMSTIGSQIAIDRYRAIKVIKK
jgi:dynactin-5